MNIHQISKINLSPNVVDGIVFWTKNPIPMIDRLDEIKAYTYYFQFTLNAYGKDVEPNIPSKKGIIIPSFKKLSNKVGRDRVIWRYDPILFNNHYTMDYHLKYFKELASHLSDYTEKCTVSFLDLYKNTERNTKPLNIIETSDQQKVDIMQQFAEIAKFYGIYVDTCAEKLSLDHIGIYHAHCIDKKRFERLGNYNLSIDKDKDQRLECGCIASIDIGAYNTCKNGCLYCYANYSSKTVAKNSSAHDPLSPLLFGEVGLDDVVRVREVKSCKDCQLNLLTQNNND
jgi:hypothetical protein